MKKILEANGQYNENINTFSKKEGVSGLMLFAIMYLGYAVLGYLVKSVSENARTIIGIIFNTAVFAITLLFLRLNKRNIETIGLRTGRKVLSIAIGGILAALVFYNNCLSYWFAGNSFIPIEKILLLVVYYFSVAVCEELVFRGYIGTRIYGLVKYKSIAVILTGLLFVLMHYPYRMAAYGMTLSGFLGNIDWIIDLFVTHIVFSLIYMKTNSLYGAMIPHWVSNLAYNIVAR